MITKPDEENPVRKEPFQKQQHSADILKYLKGELYLVNSSEGGGGDERMLISCVIRFVYVCQQHS